MPEFKDKPATPDDLIASVISTDPSMTIEHVWGDPNFNMVQYNSWLGITKPGAAPYCIGLWRTKDGAIRAYVNPDVTCTRANLNDRAKKFLEVYCDGQFNPQFSLYGPVVVIRRVNSPNPDTERPKDQPGPLDIPEIDI